MERLNKAYLSQQQAWFALPEKVLQFGTGVLLRALPDFIIDQANKQGVFNGRVVVVKSTSLGTTDAFAEQDNAYTVCIRGLKNGEIIKENHINTSISRVLTASTDWNTLVEAALQASVEIVISNTTEAGIVLQDESIKEGVPQSFPAKLLALMYQRYLHYNGDESKGWIIVPTELISDNGDKLKSIVLHLAEFNSLGDEFIQWVSTANTFCNSLVDRIVPGTPKGQIAQEISSELPYQDQLVIMSEPYTLWAISGDEKVKQKLSFTQLNTGAFVEPDITRFKELKLRLLNGTHTLTCGLAYALGFSTVKDALGNSDFYTFIHDLLMDELVPSVPFAVSKEEKVAFANQVLDRFKNPFIEHYWLSITLNYTQKMEMRVGALLQNYFSLYRTVPTKIAAGFAAYLFFMRVKEIKEGKYFGAINGTEYWIQDPLVEKVNSLSVQSVKNILSAQEIWSSDLTLLHGFEEKVSEFVNILDHQGARALLQAVIVKN